MLKKYHLSSFVFNSELFGKRLDYVLVYLFKNYSRSFFKKIILKNQVYVNNIIVNIPKKKFLMEIKFMLK
ncbi:S4 domain-containing protein [Buchnera aphidicola (Neophyllaphis podocarpi)]|uniref:S4 domain-containing protein n=1 Tax=Buchnera aphidicola TaxID=9 RepID=UPI0031B86DB0